ncbi:CcoQ/FixQ family Cbb3-type cytochrome c oxidase assembly chaperone, partial [Escherichia coli]|nr:CcoQ/FixQ family Cbb3-type cytochrome c oxidase assembly chaperone [Escherichia coli]
MEHLVIIWNVIKNLVPLNLSAVQKHEWEIF